MSNSGHSENNGAKYEIHVPPNDTIVNPDPRGLGPALLDAMKSNKDKIAQIDARTGKIQSHGEIRQRSIRVALGLKTRRIGHNDVVSICSGNHLDVCLPFLASVYVGAKVASLVSTLSRSEIAHLLKIVRPKIIFSEKQGVKLLENGLQDAGLNTEIVIFGASNKHTSFEDFLKADIAEENFQAYQPADLKETAVILFSSGTTGLPKGIRNSHFGFLTQSENFVKILGINYNINSKPPIALIYSPLYWLGGTGFLVGCQLFGGTRLVIDGFQKEEFFQLIEKYKVDIVFLASVFAYHLCKSVELFKKYDMSSISLIIITGDYVSAEHIKTLRSLLPKAYIGTFYGMTETNGQVFAFSPFADRDLIMNKPGSCGRPLPGYYYKVVDSDTGKTVGPNQLGELLVKLPYSVNGYYNNPEETKNIWDKDGWFVTGDVVYYDDDCCFYVVDRTKEMFKYQSYHITPNELELVLKSHPGVQDAVVIGIPNEMDGDHPMAVVVKKPGSNVTEGEIIKYVDGQVSDPKRLRAGVKFIDSIPVTPTGKYKRRDIRKKILDGLL